MSHLVQCDRCGKKQALPDKHFYRTSADPHPSELWVHVYFGRFVGDLDAPSKQICPDCLEMVQLFLHHRGEPRVKTEGGTIG